MYRIKERVFTIGADPELFVTDNGKFVCPAGFVKGDKKNPYKVDGGAVQVDGFALEFNIDPITVMTRGVNTHNADIFADRIKSVSTLMLEEAKQLTEKKNLKFSYKASHLFDPRVYAEAPDYSKELGCDPDWNAYTLKINPRPDPKLAKGESFRTAGGHIHLGWHMPADEKPFDVEDPIHIQDCAIVAKLLDREMAWLVKGYDKDLERQRLYGGWGVFRPKPYGMEYRTLSNFWVRNPKITRAVYSRVESVLYWLKTLKETGRYTYWKNLEKPNVLF